MDACMNRSVHNSFQIGYEWTEMNAKNEYAYVVEKSAFSAQDFKSVIYYQLKVKSCHFSYHLLSIWPNHSKLRLYKYLFTS